MNSSFNNKMQRALGCWFYIIEKNDTLHLIGVTKDLGREIKRQKNKSNIKLRGEHKIKLLYLEFFAYPIDALKEKRRCESLTSRELKRYIKRRNEERQSREFKKKWG